MLEWLPGPSLGDIARAGDLDRADRLLGQAAARLHVPPPPDVAGLTPGSDQVADLLALPLLDATARHLFGRATDLARRLLATAGAGVALHGDLHHDNVILTPDGPRVLDAQGLWGDRAYELANAFRNPRGGGARLADPAWIAARARMWSAALGVDAGRLLQWAAVKCALSIAWSHPAGVGGHVDGSHLLDRLLTEAPDVVR